MSELFHWPFSQLWHFSVVSQPLCTILTNFQTIPGREWPKSNSQIPNGHGSPVHINRIKDHNRFMFIFLLLPVSLHLVINHLCNLLTVLLQGIECILDGLVDGLLHIFTHFIYLIGTSTGLLAQTQGLLSWKSSQSIILQYSYNSAHLRDVPIRHEGLGLK